MKGNQKINYKIVLKGLLFIPIVNLYTAICASLMYPLINEDGVIGSIVMITIGGLLYGSVLWIPAGLACLAIEAPILKSYPTRNTVLLIYIIETILATTVITLILHESFIELGFIPVAVGIVLTQLTRLWFISYKGRWYKNPRSNDETPLDDFDK
ncbi:MAG: hypothetical protein HUJ25_11215 [Crocinitomicaceae bacterium]|nr:hypothetical protein [Crocinitomicaceae bacterium]